ncbi:transposase family protein [Streptomyces sp. NPDC048362]|uniref:transposase family protein n=1 Tax=Streptomyces sp. NPDC048362 TaxID=3365539 RepID=UPI0037233164
MRTPDGASPGRPGLTGAGPDVAVPARRRPRQEFTASEKSLNKAHARLRSPVEQGIAAVKRWRIFRHARCSPTNSRQPPKKSSP